MIFTIALIFFLLGLIIGSFLNVVIYRFNTKKSLGGRSACMSCSNTLSWYELVPLFSYLFLRGRCKNCKTKISAQYPIVEFTTGLIFGLLFWKFQNLFLVDMRVFATVYLYYAVLFSILVVIAVYDIKHKIIPDSLALALAILTFAGLFFFPNNFTDGTSSGILYFHIPDTLQLFSGAMISLPFALLWLVSGGRWMGLGDAKLSFGLGWLLGFPAILSATMISFWIGAIIGIMLLVISKGYKMKSEVPFAPYLILGTSLVFFFGSLFSFVVF